jgi:ABC-type transport system involved in cytochrome bd biosynthesis fused ATPase/permease subunit
MLAGLQGAGKTTLAGTLDNVLIISAEAGLLSLANKAVEYLSVNNMKDVREAYKIAKTSSHDTIFIDSLSEIGEVCLAEEKAENKDKYAYLDFFVEEKGLCVRIEDQGAGFNYQDFLELAPERLTDPHGRGIATSKIMSFDDICYIGKGNIVEARNYRK